MALFRREMSFMFAIDTNIWIYSQDKRDLLKQSVALELIATTRPLVLPWQVENWLLLVSPSNMPGNVLARWSRCLMPSFCQDRLSGYLEDN